jgi:peptide chain release factor subunit 1
MEGDISADIMNKHKKGGMSQARFQRLRKGNIHAFLTEVVDALQKVTQDNIILAGPGETKKQFHDMLPIILQKGVIAEVNVDINDEYGLFKETNEIMSEKDKQEHHRLLELIQNEILKNGLAVYGLKDTLTAVKNGQVEALLVEKDVKQKGWICEQCQIIEAGVSSLCPYCGRKTSEVNIVEEIVKIAERTDAIIEFSQDENLKKIGPVVGLLRFK